MQLRAMDCSDIPSLGNGGGSGLLLSLPQSDLVMKVGKHGKTFSSTQAKTTSAVKRADLVLFRLPAVGGQGGGGGGWNDNSITLADELLAGRCHVLANDRSATLVARTASVGLVAVGTSNALVVWRRPPVTGGGGTEDDNGGGGWDAEGGGETGPSDRKRRRATTPCRLIQPGGSGASFLVGQPHEPDPREVLRFFLGAAGGNTVGGSNSTGVTYSTSTLANLFQCSDHQIRSALRCGVPNVVATSGTPDGHVSSDEEEGEGAVVAEDHWRLIADDDVLYGQQALVQTLCEEDAASGVASNANDNINGTSTLASLTLGVSRRLLPLLLEEEDGDASTAGTGKAGRRSEKERRARAIAQKTVLLAQRGTGEGRVLRQRSRVTVDPQKIAFYALRDLYLERPSYGQADLMDRWAARLPFGDEYERCVSVEWLSEGGWVGTCDGTGGPNGIAHRGGGPDAGTTEQQRRQLVLDVDGGGPVLRLASPEVTLWWTGGAED